MATQLQNVWHLRKVAEASAKPCDICYKPTTSVLITPDQKVRASHLKDRGYCTPIVDEAEAAMKKKKEELDREIELIKKEYEEKLKKRKKAKELTQKDKSKEKSKDEKLEKSTDDNKDEDEKAEKEKNDQIKTLVDKDPTTASDEGPRIFALQKTFYQRRLNRIRNAEIAKRNRERLKSPTLFPSVPSGNLK
ncbi:MAG: hypothetical protein L6R41_002615 [Letrouitia leprolyta]|nr:MAG: hypothetical protein L6R41_002615 [Letrouitia leprolyta]